MKWKKMKKKDTTSSQRVFVIVQQHYSGPDNKRNGLIYSDKDFTWVPKPSKHLYKDTQRHTFASANSTSNNYIHSSSRRTLMNVIHNQIHVFKSTDN